MNLEFKEWENLARRPAYSDQEKTLREALRQTLGIIYQLKTDIEELKATSSSAMAMLDAILENKKKEQGEFYDRN